ARDRLKGLRDRDDDRVRGVRCVKDRGYERGKIHGRPELDTLQKESAKREPGCRDNEGGGGEQARAYLGSEKIAEKNYTPSHFLAACELRGGKDRKRMHMVFILYGLQIWGQCNLFISNSHSICYPS